MSGEIFRQKGDPMMGQLSAPSPFSLRLGFPEVTCFTVPKWNGQGATRYLSAGSK